MKGRLTIFVAILTLSSMVYAAKAGKTDSPAPAANVTVAAVTNGDDPDFVRIEGEKRFRANCSRCHAAPHKFPPRMMRTIVRHMRVRATITDEDMRYILAYMTQ
jgi:mono/diheme cytochrome c family protein